MKSLVTGFYLSSGGSVGRILHLVLCQMFFYAKILIEGRKEVVMRTTKRKKWQIE